MTEPAPNNRPAGQEDGWGAGIAVASVIATAALIFTAALVRIVPGLPRPAVSASDWIIGYGLLLAVLAFVSRHWGTGSWKVDFGLDFRPADFFWALGGLLAVLLVSNAAAQLGLDVTGKAPPTNANFGGTGPGPIVVNGFIGAGIVAPLCEEIMFRGLVLRGLLKSLRGHSNDADRIAWARLGAVAVSAALFAALHTYEAVGSESELITLALSTLALGVVNGTLVIRTNRLGAGILIHMSLNVLSVYAVVHPG